MLILKRKMMGKRVTTGVDYCLLLCNKVKGIFGLNLTTNSEFVGLNGEILLIFLQSLS
jgi:hypothetical protein